MAALSPLVPTRPIDPARPLFFSSRTTFFGLNWLSRSECRIVPSGEWSAIALRIAAAASDDFIDESME